MIPECCHHSCIWTIQNGNYKILSSPHLPYHLRKAIHGDFVELSCCDILQTMIPSMSSFRLEALPDHDPIHVLFRTRGTAHAHDTQYHPLDWGYRHTLNSKALQEVCTPTPQIQISCSFERERRLAVFLQPCRVGGHTEQSSSQWL